MPRQIFPISRLLIVSACVLASSCGGERPPVNLSPPPAILSRPDRPELPVEAITSEQAFEKWREDRNQWGIDLDIRMWTACRWFVNAGVKLDCGKAPVEIQDK